LSPRSIRFARYTSRVGGQQRHLPDLAQIQPQRIERRLDTEVELRCFLFLRLRLLVWRMLVRLALDELDAVVDQIGVEAVNLLLAELEILQPCRDLVVVEEPFLETVLGELLQLLNLGTTSRRLNLSLGSAEK